MVGVRIYQGISYFLNIVESLVMIYWLLGWILPPYHKVLKFLSRFVEPLMGPVRRLWFRLLPQARIDLSPFILILLLHLALSIVGRILL